MGCKVFTALIASVLALSPALAQDRGALIRGARVFDGKAMLGVRYVLVSSGHIAAVERRLEAPDPRDVVDGRARTLILGLIDGHVHVFTGAQADALRFGVTTVFDMYLMADAATIAQRHQQRASYSKTTEADTFTPE